MTSTATLPERSALRSPVLDIVIPVFNEEATLVKSVETVLSHLQSLPFEHRVTIADNASTDATSLLAHQLAHRHADVRIVSLKEKGRGRALKRAWSQSEILVYMDVDLSTDLNALLPLVAPLLSGHSDLAVGSRLARAARTTRGPKREVISRTYNVLLRGTLRTRFSDAQCGFKAIRRDVADQLLPLIQDDEWFFDTELLVVAERAGLRIHEVPVDWIDDPDSRVDVTSTARSVRGRLSSQVVVFALIGVLSTLAYGALYVLMRGQVGPLEANAIALAATAIINTAANRRFTFGFRGPEGAVRHQMQGLLVFGCGLAVTSGTLWALRTLEGGGHPLVEVTVLTAANLLVTVIRFVLMRVWIFRVGTRR